MSGLYYYMNAYFVLFNNPYLKWARASIQTFLDWHPDWEVEVFIVNTLHSKVSGGIFNDKRVHLNFIDKKFLGLHGEKTYCNSERFIVFQEKAHLYDKIITSDVDCLFRKELTEIVDELDANELCMYINHEGSVKTRAGASFIAYRPTERMVKFWEKYQEILYAKHTNWWNDQICLYETYCEFQSELKVFLFPYEKYCFSGLDEAGLLACELIQPRGDKDSGALSSYRQMVDTVLRQKPKMNVLILGSGPSGRQVEDLDLSNHYVIAINHAWMLTPFWTHHIYPNDYIGEFPTKLNQIQQSIDNTIYMKENLQYSNLDFRGNSMIYNALYFALQLKPQAIGTLGCDLYYPESGETHFYKGGTNDPMRYAKDYHDERFKRFLEVCERKEIKCVNYSGEARGYNPFPQANFPYIVPKS